MNFVTCFATLAAAMALSLPAVAQTANPHAGHAAHGTSAPATTGGKLLYDGEVRRVNADAKRITLSHGPLKEFDMPAMTMAFNVKDARQIAALKVGDKVRFALEASGESYVITRIESAK